MESTNPVAAHTIITVLVGLLGLCSGVGIAHFSILRKLNQMNVTFASQIQGQTEQIKTAFRLLDNQKESTDRISQVHEKTLELIKDVVENNNLLINKILAGNNKH